MKVTYIVHNYNSVKGDDRTFTVTGDMAKLVLEYQHKQHEVGITILEVDYGGTA